VVGFPLWEGGVRGILVKRFLIQSIMLTYNPNLKQFARDMRKDPTEAERKFWKEIASNDKLGFRFLRQKPIDNYIADFYCHKLKLVVEIDGDSHSETPEYDEIRTQVMNIHGLKVVRFTNDQILYNIEGIHDKMIEVIQDRIGEFENLS
jgi:very-short-patch-repair endonuclease